jgi:hypothetical protein
METVTDGAVLALALWLSWLAGQWVGRNLDNPSPGKE